jgi:hypothetical protein
MISLTVLFIQQVALAKPIYEFVKPLSDYIPVLWRYQQFFATAKRNNEFEQVFSLYAGYIVLQVIFLAIVLFILYFQLDLRGRYSQPFKMSWGSVGLLVMSFIVLLYFLVGPYSIARSDLAHGQYFFGLFTYCIALPSANFVLFLVTYSQFGTALRETPEL